MDDGLPLQLLQSPSPLHEQCDSLQLKVVIYCFLLDRSFDVSAVEVNGMSWLVGFCIGILLGRLIGEC